MTKQLESAVEARLRAGVERLGGRCFKWVCPGWSGVPDRIVILPGGRVIFVELKQEGESLRKLQKLICGKLRKLGCDVRELKGLKEVGEFLEEVEDEAR